MKHGEILERILSSGNMNKSFIQAKSNSGSAGVDGRDIEATRLFLMEHGDEILNTICTKTYTLQPVLRVEIPKSTGGVRRLGISTIVDRTIQQAIAHIVIIIPFRFASRHNTSLKSVLLEKSVFFCFLLFCS